MQRFSGFLLMLAGTAMGSYAYLPQPADDTEKVAEVAYTPSAPVSEVRRSSDETIRTFSPTSPVFRERAPLEPVDTTAAAAAAKPSTWTTVVTAEQTEAVSLKSSTVNDVETRFELARDLQRELKRVGCYQGEITGAWTPATKFAMSAFMDRVNATLPTSEPDYILLTLVQGHSGIACGVECPSGQVSAEGGRCVPRAVVAQASKKSKRLEERRMAEARLAADRRLSRLASTNDDRRLEKPQTVTAAEPEKLPWLDSNRQPNAGSATAAPRPEPLPGRMAIGGPIASVPLQSDSVATAPSAWQLMPADSRDRRDANSTKSAAGSRPSAVAALAPDAGSDVYVGASETSTSETSAEGAAIAPGGENVAGKPPITSAEAKSSKAAHRSDPDARPRYTSGGRRRQGDPRPGTMQYNIAQALGGIY